MTTYCLEIISVSHGTITLLLRDTVLYLHPCCSKESVETVLSHLKCNSKIYLIINTAKSATWIFSLCWQLYVICLHTNLPKDFIFKRETKSINSFKIQFINGTNLQMLTIMKYENLQRKWDNLGFKNNQWESLVKKCNINYESMVQSW